MTIELLNLPKVSLNKWYAGSHWADRKRIKDTYAWLIRSQTTHRQVEPCVVYYHFEFRIRPLDPSNTSAMLKL